MFYSQFSLIIFTACDDQQQAIDNLMDLFINEGFLRQCNGLNSLDTIKQLKKILNISELKFRVKAERITTLCRNSKTCKNFYLS